MAIKPPHNRQMMKTWQRNAVIFYWQFRCKLHKMILANCNCIFTTFDCFHLSGVIHMKLFSTISKFTQYLKGQMWNECASLFNNSVLLYSITLRFVSLSYVDWNSQLIGLSAFLPLGSEFNLPATQPRKCSLTKPHL